MHRAIRLIPVLMALHNAEEAAFILWRGPAPALPGPVSRIIGTITPPQFLVALAIATLLPFLCLALHGLRPGRELGCRLLLLVQAVLFVNAFAHAAGAVAAQGYVPGLATALLVNLPFSVYVARLGLRQGGLSRRGTAAYLAGALALQGPGLFGLMRLAGWAVGRGAGA